MYAHFLIYNGYLQGTKFYYVLYFYFVDLMFIMNILYVLYCSFYVQSFVL